MGWQGNVVNECSISRAGQAGDEGSIWASWGQQGNLGMSGKSVGGAGQPGDAGHRVVPGPPHVQQHMVHTPHVQHGMALPYTAHGHKPCVLLGCMGQGQGAKQDTGQDTGHGKTGSRQDGVTARQATGIDSFRVSIIRLVRTRVSNGVSSRMRSTSVESNAQHDGRVECAARW